MNSEFLSFPFQALLVALLIRPSVPLSTDASPIEEPSPFIGICEEDGILSIMRIRVASNVRNEAVMLCV